MKATVPGHGGMYSHLNTVLPTSDEYSSLQYNTTGAKGQGPSAAVIPGNQNYKKLDLDHVAHDRNNYKNPEQIVDNQQINQRNRPDDQVDA